MEKWQEENGHKVQDYNNLQVELRRQEEVVRSLRRQASLSGNANRDPAELLAMNAPAASALVLSSSTCGESNSSAVDAQNSNLAIVASQKDDVVVDAGSNKDPSTDHALAIVAEDERESTLLSQTQQTVESSDPVAVAEPNQNNELPAVAEEQTSDKEEEEEEEEEKIDLKSLNEKNLLDVFSFLDALDVLNAAQVDKEFYIRVDMLFGIGSSLVSSSKKTFTSISSAGAAINATTSASASSKVVTATAASSNEPTEASPSKTTLFLKSLVVPKVKPPTPTASGEPQTTTLQSQRPLLSYVSSIMQKQTEHVAAPVKPLLNVDVSAAAADDKYGGDSGLSKALQSQQQRPGVDAAGGAGGLGLTASMADSMADKLTPTELAVIISMTEKLRQRDKDIKRLTAEREDLAARLEGTEAVKEFLIGRVQKTEAELKKSADAAVLFGQQTASDQEVIAFLDGRVQELERTSKATSENKNKLDSLLKQSRDQNDKRQKVLEDMLQFERQQLAEQEKEWRSTKKVLVKEVKHCHAQIATLKAERDSFQQQNQQLKQALLKRNGTKSIK